MGEKGRLKGEEVLEVVRRIVGRGETASTGAIFDEISEEWRGRESKCPKQQAVYLHLVRLEKAGKVTHRRVGQGGGGQHAEWALLGAETPLPASIEERDVSDPGPR